MGTACAAAGSARKCGKRFTTYERANCKMPMIVNRTAIAPAYDREKNPQRLMRALHKRPVPPNTWMPPSTASSSASWRLGEREIRAA